MKKSVPNKNFPFITCYTRLLDRRDLTPVSEYIDGLKFKDDLTLGKIKNLKGISQYIIEFDIWNNEPDVSGGFTQQLFNDAKDCNITIHNINRDNNGLEFKIRNIVNGMEKFQIYEDKFPVCGNVTKQQGILKGNGDHCVIQVAVEMKNRVDGVNKIPFLICFNYNDSDTDVSLKFQCNMEIEFEKSYISVNEIKNNGNVFIGNIANMNCKNSVIEATSNGKLQDQLILNDDKYYLFLKNGIYNVNIKNSRINRRFSDINIDNGITENYSKVTDGLIYRQYDDIFEYYDGNYAVKEVCGTIVDEYGSPIKNAEIIITQGENLVVYYVTDNNGNYRFRLDNGVYDVRIRSSNKRLKIFRDFKFRNNRGFFSEIKNQFKVFEYDFNSEYN